MKEIRSVRIIKEDGSIDASLTMKGIFIFLE